MKQEMENMKYMCMGNKSGVCEKQLFENGGGELMKFLANGFIYLNS